MAEDLRAADSDTRNDISSVKAIVQLSFDDGLQKKLLLRIPHDILITLSARPRKWLCYATYAICGTTGALFFHDNDEPADLDGGVNGEDHFVYRLSGDPAFVDWDARVGTHDWVPKSPTYSELQKYYGGCPFTKMDSEVCAGCHLIHPAKGSNYLRDILSDHHDPIQDMGIDDPRNMLLLAPRLHSYFNDNSVAFLRTPNEFLKSNEIPGRESEEPDKYIVTLQAFTERARAALPHNASSGMTEGSGLSHLPSDRHIRPDIVPNSTLLDITYAAALVVRWGSRDLRDLRESMDESASKYYAGGAIKRGEDLKGGTTKEQHNEERNGRMARQNGDAPASSSATHNNTLTKWEQAWDVWDTLLWMPYMLTGISPEEIKAEHEESMKKWEREEVERIGRWWKEVSEGPPEDATGCGEELFPHPDFDAEDEKPVRL